MEYAQFNVTGNTTAIVVKLIHSTIVRWPDPTFWEIMHTYTYTVISIGLLAGIAGRVTEKW